MTEEQRAEAKAARERLRRLLDGEGYFSVYSTVPYLAKYSFDLENVLRDYFAEHPADEADPADADFVRSLGTPSRDDKDAVVVFLTPVNRTRAPASTALLSNRCGIVGLRTAAKCGGSPRSKPNAFCGMNCRKRKPIMNTTT